MLSSPGKVKNDTRQWERYRDYFMVGECVRFLKDRFTSCEGSLNERVSAANE